MYALALGFGTCHTCPDAGGELCALELCESGSNGEEEATVGGRGVDVLLKGDEVYVEVPELIDGKDEFDGGSSKPVVAPDKYHIDLALAYIVKETLVV